ncbi:RNA methyltransferase [Methanonatronarchaeum sp. AMET-Sl]|uniref:RNA methyltransferase n=1 Tax=Methanonatronarchaeum sp. AMET-Sl TaxID=3037654 RepID=UPI00244DA821|nr:RNA methyltransferase [Methanonatronarchaeum sp. AMET-Sl]WGI16897.1 RNA methyltransferase [Methanonatronarchaeum sp. AMET-Sl]
MVRVVLVNPKFEGNVGFVARLMANFGYDDLVLVDPVELGDEAWIYASNAGYILDDALVVDSFWDAVEGVDVKVATTGVPGVTDSCHVRMPYYSPKELGDRLDGFGGDVALVFGREDHGLPNKVVRECEFVVSIPTSSDYPVMNLSHAVGILLYELSDFEKAEIPVPGQEEMDVLHKKINQVLELIDYPSHKKGKTKLMMKRIIGRAGLTKRETYTLLGILRDTIRKLKEK